MQLHRTSLVKATRLDCRTRLMETVRPQIPNTQSLGYPLKLILVFPKAEYIFFIINIEGVVRLCCILLFGLLCEQACLLHFLISRWHSGHHKPAWPLSRSTCTTLAGATVFVCAGLLHFSSISSMRDHQYWTKAVLVGVFPNKSLGWQTSEVICYELLFFLFQLSPAPHGGKNGKGGLEGFPPFRPFSFWV